jgi:hypothetical protein
MFISYALSAANGFKKWSAAHPATKYAPKSNKAGPITPAASGISSSHAAESARSSRPKNRLQALRYPHATRRAASADCRRCSCWRPPEGKVVGPGASVRPNGRQLAT